MEARLSDELAATLTLLDRSSTHHGMKHYCAHVVTTLHSIRHACGLYIEQCMQTQQAYNAIIEYDMNQIWAIIM